MTEKHKELVNTILTQFADNKEMTYSILGKSIVKMAVDIKIEELSGLKSDYEYHMIKCKQIDKLLNYYKNLEL